MKKKIKSKTHYLLFIAFTLIIPNTSLADEIHLSNGDSVSGTILSLDNGVLALQSSILGNIDIPIADVASFSTNQIVSVVFTNNDQLTGKLSGSANGLAQINSKRLGIIKNIPLSDITAIHQATAASKPSSNPAGTNNKTNNVVPIQTSRPEGFDHNVVLTNDEVLLKSGDRLVGTIQFVTADKIVIDTEFAKELTIERAHVESLQIKEPVTIIFNDDKYLTGILSTTPDRRLQVNSQRAGSSEVFDLAEIKSVIRGDPAAIAREGQKVKFTGNADVGLSTSSGNSNDDSYIVSGELTARTTQNRYGVRVERKFERSDGEKTKDETFGSIKYDHFLNEKWYLFNSASFEENEIELLNLRTALSGGFGYQFFEQDDLLMSVELGLGYVNEDFENERDNDFLAARWGYNYEHELLSWLSIFHHQEGLYGLETSDDIVVKTRSGLKFPLGNGFNAKTQANIDWDKSPAEGADSTDKEYNFSLGYEF